MKKQLKLIAILLMATTLTQAFGMRRLATTLYTKALATAAASMTAMRTAATRFAPRISVSASSPARILAARFLSNPRKRIAAGTLATTAAVIAEQTKAESKETSVESQKKEQNVTEKSSSIWYRLPPSVARYKTSEKKPIFTVDDLKREVNDVTPAYEYGRYIKVFKAPSSLERALKNLSAEQTQAINEYHRAMVENTSIEKRMPLKRNVELLIRDEEERNEILDNLRWLQESTTIGRVPNVLFDEAPSQFLLHTTLIASVLHTPWWLVATGLQIAYRAGSNYYELPMAYEREARQRWWDQICPDSQRLLYRQ